MWHQDYFLSHEHQLIPAFVIFVILLFEPGVYSSSGLLQTSYAAEGLN